MVVTRNQVRFNQDPPHLSINVKGEVGDGDEDGNHEIIEDPKHVLKITDAMEDGKKCCRLSLAPENSILITFLNETSIHGVKYIAQENRHWGERLFWLVAFLLGVSSSACLIHNLWDRYQKTPVIITFDVNEVNTSTIPFPAVTFCNINKISNRLVENLKLTLNETNSSDLNHIEAIKKLEFVRYLCPESDNISGESTNTFPHGKRLEDVIEFLINNTNPCDEMIKNCEFNEESLNCSDLFKPFITPIGKCCTFNIIPLGLLFKRPDGIADNNPSNEFVEEQYFNKPDIISHWAEWQPRRQRGSGQYSGLSILIESKIDDYYCPSWDAEGVRVTIHSPFELPDMHYSSAIHLGKHVLIDVKADVTKADPDIRDYPQEKRKCYFGNEKSLKFYRPYTGNCDWECYVDHVASVCGCLPFYTPKYSSEHMGTNVCSRDPDSVESNCVETEEWELENDWEKFCPNCDPSCEEIEYSHKVSMQKLLTWDHKGSLATSLRDDELKDSTAIVHIYFGSKRTIPKLRKALYGWADLIANTGGILGLCLGFSVISGIELIYFFTLRAFWRARGRETAAIKRRCLKVSSTKRPLCSKSMVVNLPPCQSSEGVIKVHCI